MIVNVLAQTYVVFFRLNQWKANNNSMFDNIELTRDERSNDSFAYLYMFII